MKNMDELIAQKLGVAAMQHVLRCLAEGNSLPSQLLRLVGSVPGYVWAFLPTKTDLHSITSYDYGGVVSCLDSERCIAEYIQKHLTQSTNTVAIFEHALAKPSDPALQREKINYSICGEEVYFWLNNQTADLASILNVIQ